MAAALVATLVTYVLIFVLDRIADAECSPPAVDEEVRFYIEPLSLLIGLTWKQAFIVSIVTVTAEIDVFPKPVETFIMAVVVASIIVPAWRMYIVPVVMHPEWHARWKAMVEDSRQQALTCTLGMSNARKEEYVRTEPNSRLQADNIIGTADQPLCVPTSLVKNGARVMVLI